MNNPICDNCPIRLFNTKSYNLQGIGNPFYGNCIVVPNVDYKAYKNKSMDFSSQVEIIKDVIIPSTGVEESNFYIVPFIRCNEQISCNIDIETYKRCLYFLGEDIKKYNFKNILLLGNAARIFLDVNINEHLNSLFLSENNRRYFVNYSPLVQYVDEKLFDTFKEYLIKWYNSINSEMFDYNLKLL